MSSISTSAASAQVRAAPKAKVRNAALDRARTFITLLVLIHHSVIAYTYFGHTDPQSFLGFDIVVIIQRQLLHGGDVLPVGAVRVAEPAAQRDRLVSCATGGGAWACPSRSAR